MLLEARVRELRDFRPLQLYGVTQRGNQAQRVYRDNNEDFAKALDLMRLYAVRHGVRVHGWCLMHNHGHWIFEASTEESISNLMRDMQSRHSRYLNAKYKKKPWLLLGPLRGRRRRRSYSPYWRSGPVNWSPRFDAVFLDGAGFPSFLRYIEANPVEARLVKRAVRWRWSSARAHCAGSTADGLLCLDRWQHLFGQPRGVAGVFECSAVGARSECAAVAGDADGVGAESATAMGGAGCGRWGWFAVGVSGWVGALVAVAGWMRLWLLGCSDCLHLGFVADRLLAVLPRLRWPPPYLHPVSVF